MKKKHIALLLAAAMTVTSLDATAMIASAADFSDEVEASVELSESTEEITAEPEQNEETEDSEAEISFEDPEISEDAGISVGGVLRR